MDIKEYYQNLLIVQYNDKPKAKSTIGALFDVMFPVNMTTGNYLWDDVRDAFNVDTAVGVQLDIIGYYVGLDRLYKGDTFDYMAFGFSDNFTTQPTNVTGFASTSDFSSKDGKFIGNEDIISVTNKLSDDDFRFLLKLKILINNSNHSCAALDEGLYQFFGTDLYYIDNLDMTISYFISRKWMRLISAIEEKSLLPKPMGIRIEEILEADIYFSLTDENSNTDITLIGYVSADDFNTKDGTLLSASDII